MLFWEVRFKYITENNEQKDEEPHFFGTLEECMAYVLAQPHLDIFNVEFTSRFLGVWKEKITLNDSSNREVK